MNRETKEAASRFCEKHELYGSSNICSLYATPLSEWSNKAFIAGAEWHEEQLSAPTDEEIERKAHNEYRYGYLSRYEENKESYITGYKQALKDLGHKN